MTIVSLTCPKCGGSLKFDDSREFGFCEYCGNKIMIQQEINHIHVNQNFDKQVDRLLVQASEHIKLKKADEALKLLNDIKKIDSTRPEQYLLMAQATVLKKIKNGKLSGKVEDEVQKYLSDYAAYSGVTITVNELMSGLGFSTTSFKSSFNAALEKHDYSECVRLLNQESGSKFDMKDRNHYAPYIWDLMKACLANNHHLDKSLTELQFFKNPFNESEVEDQLENLCTEEFYEFVKTLNIPKEEIVSMIRKSLDYVCTHPDMLIPGKSMPNLSDRDLCFGLILDLCLDVTDYKNDKTVVYAELYPAFDNVHFPDSYNKNQEDMDLFKINRARTAFFIKQALDEGTKADKNSLMQAVKKKIKENYEKTHPPVAKKGLFGTKMVSQPVPPEQYSDLEFHLDGYLSEEYEIRDFKLKDNTNVLMYLFY
ncbi:hypothetical protein O8W32_01560 [Methanomassiliicoccales archaeon LGM-DZ1]|nr:hypothetical protein O8W32_01560 [Methanomassiliicoccales archaeon LGM-DZ1]